MDRYKWRDAVLESDLTATEKIVAVVFEWHASKGTERVWCAPERLQALTSLGRTASKRAVQRLIQLGWLAVTEPARQHRAARYALTIPRGSGSDPLSESRGSLEDTRGSLNGTRGSRSDPDPCSIPVLNPEESGALSDLKARTKGTRLPRDWTPSEELKAWTRENFPQLNGPTVADGFRDWYWAAPGSSGVRADWDAVWRSWCRREAGGASAPGGGERGARYFCEPCGGAHPLGKHKHSAKAGASVWDNPVTDCTNCGGRHAKNGTCP